ncbi:MAG: class I SAM-dependent methyltransferase, partial [Candidatus Auribacterota bacterium]|nr:class I SAM-dependent methyltransferase [Candidatus Auribacterota bacterium]
AHYAGASYSRPGLHFAGADGLLLPFRDEAFEMVIAVCAIVHTMDRDGARMCLSEISRVMKPGGILIFTTPNRKLSQDLYQYNPEDNPRLFFCHLLRTEYYRDDLEALILSPETGPGRLFSSVSIGGVANTALQPIWKEVLAELGSRRFSGPGKEALLPALARRILPQSFKARYFFRKIRQACRKRNITLRDIARGVRHYPDVSDEAVEHFIVIARKE